MITQKKLKRILDYNPKTGIFRWKIRPANHILVGNIAGTKNKKGYIAIQIKGKIYGAHQLAWLYITGNWPKKDIDHKDQVKHHNWFSNLRYSSQQVNSRNTGNFKSNTSGVKGTHYCKKQNKWKAYIGKDNKLYNLGYFDDFNDAALARYLAERKAKWHLSDPNSPAQEYCIAHGLIERPIWVTIKMVKQLEAL